MPLGNTFPLNTRLVVVMVGLPARGKTYTARKLARYLSWLGYRAHVFNVGNHRRRISGSQVPHSFFDPDNTDGASARRLAAESALEELHMWMEGGGQIGIYDATNSTTARRLWVRQHCERAGMEVLFIEVICNDSSIIEGNIRETKLTSPDYVDANPEAAVADFRARIAHYAQAYEPIIDDRLHYIKIIDLGRQLIINRIEGFLTGRIVQFVANLHTTPRPIWLTRHGQSEANVVGRIGEDTNLSPAGVQFSRNLTRFLNDRVGESISIWTSTLKRTIQTGQALGRPTSALKLLDEIDAGVCDGMTYAEIQRTMPEDYAARTEDKLRYRYPRGESYEDVIRRLDPVLLELERQRGPILVIAHQAVLRTLYAYFTDHPREECPHLHIPLHTVIELTPKAYGTAERQFRLGPGIG